MGERDGEAERWGGREMREREMGGREMERQKDEEGKR